MIVQTTGPVLYTSALYPDIIIARRTRSINVNHSNVIEFHQWKVHSPTLPFPFHHCVPPVACLSLAVPFASHPRSSSTAYLLLPTRPSISLILDFNQPIKSKEDVNGTHENKFGHQRERERGAREAERENRERERQREAERQRHRVIERGRQTERRNRAIKRHGETEKATSLL